MKSKQAIPSPLRRRDGQLENNWAIVFVDTITFGNRR